MSAVSEKKKPLSPISLSERGKGYKCSYILIFGKTGGLRPIQDLRHLKVYIEKEIPVMCLRTITPPLEGLAMIYLYSASQCNPSP